jgi:hypothetical protein
MELNELLKKVDILKIKDHSNVHKEMPSIYGEEFTLIIGHQPEFKNGSLDVDDPNWTDNVMEPLNINVVDVHQLEGHNDLYHAFDVKIGENNYDIILENDCGFVVGYSSVSLFNTIQREK